MRLGDCCKTNLHTYSDKEKWSLIRYLDTGSITEGRIDEIQTLYPGVDKIPSRARRKASVGDILFSTVRPNQKHYGIIEAGTENLLVSTGFTVVTVDTTIAYPYFIYYYLTQSSVIESLQAIAEQSTSTYPSIKPSDIEDIELDLPELETQKKIGSTLRMLDRKIALNEEINDNLQQQAFVLFDKLMIDADNNDCTLSDYAYLNPKRTLAKNQIARSIDMSQLSTSGAFPSGWDMKPFNGGMRFSNGDTLLARITPCLENGKTAFIDFLDKDEIAFGSTEYIVLSPKSSVPPEMMYCLARYPAFVDYAVKNMNGSSGRQRVSTETIGQFQLPKFDKQDLLEFRALIAPMFLKMRYNSIENMRLAKLCDALLPKLISGELDISSIQL